MRSAPISATITPPVGLERTVLLRNRFLVLNLVAQPGFCAAMAPNTFEVIIHIDMQNRVKWMSPVNGPSVTTAVQEVS